MKIFLNIIISKFKKVISEIEDYLNKLNKSIIDIPYTTNIWIAQLL